MNETAEFVSNNAPPGANIPGALDQFYVNDDAVDLANAIV